MTPQEQKNALARIDFFRKKLRDDFWRDMAKLDADERELLGLVPTDGEDSYIAIKPQSE